MTRPWADIKQSSAYPIALPALIDISDDAKESVTVDIDGLHLFALVVP